jgi:hypothetical protein
LERLSVCRLNKKEGRCASRGLHRRTYLWLPPEEYPPYEPPELR